MAQAGDTCSIHSGVYRETVAITHSGSAGAPIQFEAFGRDEVTVSGADEVGNWSLAAGSIYQTSVGWSLGQGRDQVFVDGVALVEARTPNTPEPRWAYPIDGLSSLSPLGSPRMLTRPRARMPIAITSSAPSGKACRETPWSGACMWAGTTGAGLRKPV